MSSAGGLGQEVELQARLSGTVAVHGVPEIHRFQIGSADERPPPRPERHPALRPTDPRTGRRRAQGTAVDPAIFEVPAEVEALIRAAAAGADG